MADAAPVALVTGGTRGIGRAITERLVVDGWKVLATYRSDESSARVMEALSPNVAVFRADIVDTAANDAAVAACVERFGSLDHLVGAAAIGLAEPLATTTDAAWDEVIAINLTGTFRMMRAALPHVTASPRGRIVTISSVAATMGSAGRSAYSASKSGLLGLTKTIAAEVASSGTTANLVVVGPTAETGQTADTDPAFIAAIARRIPLRRFGQPAETAHAVRFLLDDLSGWITGSSVVVDGGLSI